MWKWRQQWFLSHLRGIAPDRTSTRRYFPVLGLDLVDDLAPLGPPCLRRRPRVPSTPDVRLMLWVGFLFPYRPQWRPSSLVVSHLILPDFFRCLHRCVWALSPCPLLPTLAVRLGFQTVFHHFLVVSLDPSVPWPKSTRLCDLVHSSVPRDSVFSFCVGTSPFVLTSCSVSGVPTFESILQSGV